jgi:ATP-dependent protease Clp ATPase subunit
MRFVDNDKKGKNITITLEDLYAYGVPKELLRRVGRVLNLSKLDKEDYFNILTGLFRILCQHPVVPKIVS